MTFSEREGFVPSKSLQIESMDEDLQNLLWIELESLFNSLGRDSHLHHSQSEFYRGFLECIWTRYFKQPKSKLVGVNTYHIVHSNIQPRYMKFAWHQVYSFLEFVAWLLSTVRKDSGAFKNNCNDVMERESSAWRFVNDEICRITEPYEISNIETAFDGVGRETASHLNSMLADFSQKERKNFRGCVNNAMSALEAYAGEITNQQGKTLSEICKSKKLLLHPTLNKSMEMLYSFAGDQTRHAEKPGDDVIDIEVARFIMLQCCSYINLMKSKQES